MAIEVAKIELKNVQDASGLEACIARGQFAADEVIAVIGKTEGNGGVNDFTRILADQAFRRALQKHGKRSEAEIAAIPMVWSGGCDGVITPHATVFASNGRTGAASKSRLAVGTAMSAELLPEDIGRPAMVEKVADAVRTAMRDAGIDDPKDVHYVQTKTPLLTIESVRERPRAAMTSLARCTTPWASPTARPRSGSRSGSARSRCRAPSKSAEISTFTPLSHRAPRASN
jgi:cyanuric acid amidohydrolase